MKGEEWLGEPSVQNALRDLEIQVDEGLPVYVIPVRPDPIPDEVAPAARAIR